MAEIIARAYHSILVYCLVFYIVCFGKKFKACFFCFEMRRLDEILLELKRHLPFSLGSSFSAVILVLFVYNFWSIPSGAFFEVLHPMHVIFSAVATSAIYWKYRKDWVGSILVGVVGSILVGSLSDILLPWLAGNIFGLETSFHLPILEEPLLILTVAFLGSVGGMIRYDIFRIGHSAHIFLSVFSSLFYLLAFSGAMSFGSVIVLGCVVFLAVYIPCCVSDIVFPILFVRK
jgi:hypothetical protein